MDGKDARADRRRLLLVEDEPELRRALRRVFSEQYDVHEARDGVEGLELAQRLKPEVVISDQRMPQMDGVEMLRRLRCELPRTIRILVTGYRDYQPVVRAVNTAHIHHFVEKPFNIDELRMVVGTLVRNAELEAEREELLEQLRSTVEQLEARNAELRRKESELAAQVAARTLDLRQSNEGLRRANDRLRELALRDGLTGLFNHRAFMEQLARELSRCRRYARPFSLLFLDLDDFKIVNDTHGHRVGDDVLRGVAELLCSGPTALRHSDFSARYGGEEFCVILPETSFDGGCATAERIRRGLEQFPWLERVPQLIHPLTVSVGVAGFPDHADSTEGLLEAADAALYEAKRSGKNRVAFAQLSTSLTA